MQQTDHSAHRVHQSNHVNQDHHNKFIVFTINNRTEEEQYGYCFLTMLFSFQIIGFIEKDDIITGIMVTIMFIHVLFHYR